MNGTLYRRPLSPPTSPRMSAYTSASIGLNSQAEQKTRAELTPEYSDDSMALLHAQVPGLGIDMKHRPVFRSHKSFPYTLQNSPGMGCQSNTPETSSGTSPAAGSKNTSNLCDSEIMGLPTVTFGGSAPTSPQDRLTPTSPKQEQSQTYQDSNGLEIDDGEGDFEDDEQPRQPMTAAEIRAQKRKMKRFRLTHNQTRFLMSEFARQAHPDAAHRERLAREIPGLSPRQVQVWFQNRRAKLKRLTSDDRERMMRSRALPDDFDMTRALHSPFGVAPNTNPPMSQPPPYAPAFPESHMIRPLNLDALRRFPEGPHMSPTSNPPSFGYAAYTPPQSATETLSPLSGVSGDGTPFNFSPALDASPRRSNPFSGSLGPTSNFTSQPHVPRPLHIQDRTGRTRSDSVASPLRTSVSYTSNPEYTQNDSASQAMGGASLDQQPDQRNTSGSMLPYGLGYGYQQIPGFQASAAARMRSFSGTIPRRIELNHFAPPSRNGGNPQSANFPTFQHSPLGTPQNFNMAQMSAPHHITSFQNSYLRPDGDHNEPFPSIGSIVEGVEHEHVDNGEHPDGGVHLPSGFQ